MVDEYRVAMVVLRFFLLLQGTRSSGVGGEDEFVQTLERSAGGKTE